MVSTLTTFAARAANLPRILDLAFVVAALLVLWTTRSWGSVRRIPGENRYEDASS